MGLELEGIRLYHMSMDDDLYWWKSIAGHSLSQLLLQIIVTRIFIFLQGQAYMLNIVHYWIESYAEQSNKVKTESWKSYMEL